ncbi:MAG: DUF2784 domain-containing protein [Alphaproteobacteria bacterium]|nr:DUF2784 domain-containing protein [Alphaproteobacteria bacterium]
MAALLANIVLAVHGAVIVFNIFGLIAVPLGAGRGWAFVRVFWWRALHLASLAVVALQAAFGRACFLTLWQRDLEGDDAARPLVQGWIEDLIYWDLPMWAFAVGYATLLIYTGLLWLWVRPQRS